MRGSQRKSRFKGRPVDCGEFAWAGSIRAGNTFDNEVLPCKCTCFVEATDVHSSSEGDAERFGAEDG